MINHQLAEIPAQLIGALTPHGHDFDRLALSLKMADVIARLTDNARIEGTGKAPLTRRDDQKMRLVAAGSRKKLRCCCGRCNARAKAAQNLFEPLSVGPGSLGLILRTAEFR